MPYLSNYITDFGNTVSLITTVLEFTERSRIGTREDLISIVGNTLWSNLVPSLQSCPYCFGVLRKVLILTDSGYEVLAEVPFTFASNEWTWMLAELEAQTRIISIETTGERINNHYLKLWL